MPWRKWFVRILVFSIVGTCAGGVFLYQRYTNPTAVRAQVLAKLKTHFAGALVTVDSARLSILGGINVDELRLARKDDPDKNEVLHVPSAIFYHDKEKILDGELAFRRIELRHPHLRAVRAKDGTWNLQGLTGPLQTNLPLPTISIYQGTLVLDDRSDGGTGSSLELTNVDLQLVNDPLPTVTIDGSATSDVAGKLRVQGQWQRETQEITLTLKAERISLQAIAIERFANLCPTGTLKGLKLTGNAELKADVAYRPALSQPLSYDVLVHVSHAQLQHPNLPLPLEELEASCRCCNGALQGTAKAKSGQTEIEARGTTLLPGTGAYCEGHLDVRHLEIHQNLFAALFTALPEKARKEARKLYDLFLPSGVATFRADVVRRDGVWTTLTSGEPSHIQLLPESMLITFEKFPYPLVNISGSVDMNLLTELVQLDVTGYTPHPISAHAHAGPPNSTSLAPLLREEVLAARGSPVFIKGTWRGKGTEQADCRFEISAADVPLDERIVNALPVNKHMDFKKLAKSFNAAGKGDIKALIRHEPGAAEFHNEYHAYFHEAAICWDSFPYPLENASGYLDIFPKYWEFRGGHGTHRGSEVWVQGGSSTRGEVPAGGPGPGVILYIDGSKLPVDEELHRALGPIKQLARSWETFRPSGILRFHAEIYQRLAAPEEDTDVLLNIAGVAIEPVFFPYGMHAIAGNFHYHKNKLEIRRASANHQGTTLTLEHGLVELPKDGGQYTKLTGLKVDNLVVNEDLLRALSGGLRKGVAALNLRGPVTVETDLVVSQRAESGSQPDIWWDGLCRLKNAKLTTGLEWSHVTGTVGALGRYNGQQFLGLNGNILLDEATLLGQPFHDLHAKLQIQDTAPDVLMVDLKAPIFGGDVSGLARVDFNSTLRYELNLTGSQIDLAQFGRHNLGPASQLQGLAMARLHLTGTDKGSDTLDGNGTFDVPNGRLYNLPLLLDILKFLGLRSPDHTYFEEMHAQFGIHGQRVSVAQLDILGRALSLTGKGEFNLDGTDVALDFYPGWPWFNQILPSPMKTWPKDLSKNVLTIEMRGKVTANEKDRKFTMKPIPGIVDPILHLPNSLFGPPNQDNRGEPHLLPQLGGTK